MVLLFPSEGQIVLRDRIEGDAASPAGRGLEVSIEDRRHHAARGGGVAKFATRSCLIARSLTEGGHQLGTLTDAETGQVLRKQLRTGVVEMTG